MRGTVGYFAYDRDRLDAVDPEVIENLVYADFRIDMKVQGRELNLMLLGKMASDENCCAYKGSFAAV